MTFTAPGAGPALPALRFEMDGFCAPKDRIMGRHSAGQSFLKAFVEAAEGGVVTGVGADIRTADHFAPLARAIDPRVEPHFFLLDQQARIAAHGAMHLADPSLGIHAALRQSVGPAAYSLTGVTHTISSMGAMPLITDMAVAPVMPWDGLICTSEAVVKSVLTLMDAQKDYLRWRFGASAQVGAPQLAVIPLGVDCPSFAGFSGDSGQARKALGLDADDIAFLFLGRLSFHAKAHPLPMYLGLEEAARASGKKLVLIQCGWFANEWIERAFRDGAAQFAPSVRHIILDGRIEEERNKAWSACDIFMSLSDNIQETFGLTVVEAMAAGKPVIATDWDGYRQTLRHGETGFMIPTFMPESFGDEIALSHVAGTLTYDRYLAQACSLVSVDLRALREAIMRLVHEPELRRTMGQKGQALARAQFDWSGIMRAYRAFWADLAARRAKAATGPAPRPAAQLDPGHVFAGYPTRRVNGSSKIRKRDSAPLWQEIRNHPLGAGPHPLPDHLVAAIQGSLEQGAQSPDALAASFGMTPDQALKTVSALVKWGLVEWE